MRLFIDILFFQCLLPFLLLVIATNPIDVDALKVAHQKTHDPPLPASHSSIPSKISQSRTVPAQTSSATPSSTSDTPVSAQSDIYRYVTSCSASQKGIEKSAWEDACKLAAAHKKWTSKKYYQSAQDAYEKLISLEYNLSACRRFSSARSLGKDSGNNPWFGKSWAGTLEANIKRQLNIRNDEAPGSTYAYLDCNEEDSRSKLDWCKPGKGIIGYTWDGLGWFWIAYYVVPCPLFFDLDKTNDLTQQTERANGKPYVPSIIDNSVDSPGATYFHETYRWKDTVCIPKTDTPVKDYPETYPRQDVYNLAKDRNTKEAYLKVESYTLAATALYVQQVCHLQSPRVSYRVAPPAIQAPNGDLKDSKYRATGLEYPPPGWKARFSNSTINSTEDRRLPRPDPKSGLKWADPNYRMQRPHDEQYDTGQLPPVWITDSPLAVLGDPC